MIRELKGCSLMADQCQRKGCTNPATHEVILELRARANHDPARTSPLVICCGDHKDVTWDEMVPPDFWRRLSDSFVNAGYQRPSRKHSKLVVQRLELPH